jgi:hypothetical protein
MEKQGAGSQPTSLWVIVSGEDWKRNHKARIDGEPAVGSDGRDGGLVAPRQSASFFRNREFILPKVKN